MLKHLDNLKSESNRSKPVNKHLVLKDMDLKDIIKGLLSFIESKEELFGLMKNINGCLDRTFQSCLTNCLYELDTETDNNLGIESILDYLHDDLHTGHWSETPLEVRQAFAGSCYVKTIILLKSACTHTVLRECLKTVDMGILLGAPLQENSKLLTSCATFLSDKLNSSSPDREQTSTPKRKHCTEHFINCKIKGVNIDVLSCPSLQTFNNKYFTPKVPVKLQDCMTNWPAATKWVDVNYLLRIAGDRTVPVEIGSNYADENWSQKLMTIKDFIRKYYLEESNVAYLAQHNLFDQIPELRNDIYVPEYCCLSDCDDEGEPDINAWFGPANTVSPLHHDPKNNILAQVFGVKQLILYAPSDSLYLYPHENNLLSNTAQVDPINPNLEKYPTFKKAVAFSCLLRPGEMLYIPPKWWHHVKALDKSFSVSFWWN